MAKTWRRLPAKACHQLIDEQHISLLGASWNFPSQFIIRKCVSKYGNFSDANQSFSRAIYFIKVLQFWTHGTTRRSTVGPGSLAQIPPNWIFWGSFFKTWMFLTFWLFLLTFCSRDNPLCVRSSTATKVFLKIISRIFFDAATGARSRVLQLCWIPKLSFGTKKGFKKTPFYAILCHPTGKLIFTT
jgi:hypothetical protein